MKKTIFTLALVLSLPTMARDESDILRDLSEAISVTKEVYENKGMNGLVELTDICYARSIEKWQCVYLDTASRRIDQNFKAFADKEKFEYTRQKFFRDKAVEKRIVTYLKTGISSKKEINEYLKAVTETVNTIIDREVIFTNEVPEETKQWSF